jgi:hypothetical protein
MVFDAAALTFCILALTFYVGIAEGENRKNYKPSFSE